MLTKMKLAIVVCGTLLGGVAAAQPVDLDHDAPKADVKAKRAEMKQKMLDRFDTNKDGKLDKTEREVMRDVLSTELFKKLDTDGNGQISLAEFKAGQMRFAKHHHGAARRFGRGLGNR